MLTLDLKSRMKNKTFWVAIISAIVLLIQQLGFKDLIPSNWSDIVNTTLSILVMLGIVVDTSTPGISDQVIEEKTVQANNIEQFFNEVESIRAIKEGTKKENTTTSTNNTVTENSQSADSLNASSKITVDVPQE